MYVIEERIVLFLSEAARRSYEVIRRVMFLRSTKVTFIDGNNKSR